MRGETNARVVGSRDGRPLILSNALGATAEMWEPQLPAFADLRVVLYDHSPRSSIADLGRDVIALADRFALHSFSFCGLSLGGMISAGAAALGVLERLPATRRLARSSAHLRAQPAIEAIYAFVARHRARLGRLVPDGSAPRRYP